MRFPALGRGVCEEFLHVVGGAGFVRAEDDRDVLLRKILARVELLEAGVVPRGDPAVENEGESVGSEGKAIYTWKVVGDGDGADDEGEVPGGMSLAAFERTLGFILIEGRVGAAENDDAF